MPVQESLTQLVRKNLQVCEVFVSTLSSLSSVLCVATADMACLSLDEVSVTL